MQGVRRQIELVEARALVGGIRLRRCFVKPGHVGGGGSLLAVLDVEHDARADIDARFEALRQGGVVHENIITPGVGGDEAKALAKELRDWVAKEIGPIAKPKDIRFGENLPKTRSGKIMRRLLRSLAKGETITQDVSTLENPAILGQLGQTY